MGHGALGRKLTCSQGSWEDVSEARRDALDRTGEHSALQGELTSKQRQDARQQGRVRMPSETSQGHQREDNQ